MTATLRQFVPDDRVEKATKLPLDRPPTRAEIWSYYHAVYFDLKGHAPSTICTDRCQDKPTGELEAFCRVVRDGEPSPVTGADARAALEVALTAVASVEQGAPVRLGAPEVAHA